MTQVKAVGKVSPANYETYLEQDGSLQLIYQDVMSFKQFEQWFFSKQDQIKASDFHFNRVLVNLDGAVKKLTLINDATRRVYEAKLANVSQDQLQKLVTTQVTRQSNCRHMLI